MEPKPVDFHSEEYKQIRSEVVGLVEKVDQYFRYAVLVPTAVYSWLVTAAVGTHVVAATSSAAVPCLKIPSALAWVAWLIPPVFVFFSGLVSLAFGVRISQMGEYLLKLEDALGLSILGWEKFNKPLRRRLTWARRLTWFVILAACVASSTVGIVETKSIQTYCLPK